MSAKGSQSSLSNNTQSSLSNNAQSTASSANNAHPSSANNVHPSSANNAQPTALSANNAHPSSANNVHPSSANNTQPTPLSANNAQPSPKIEPLNRPTETALLGFPKEQFSEDAESSLPLYHLWLDARATGSLQGVLACNHSFCVVHGSGAARALSVFTVPALPEPLQHESTSFHNKARSSDSIGLSWGVEPDCLNAEQFETGWEKGDRKEKEWRECDVCRCNANRKATSESGRACVFGSCYCLLPRQQFDLSALHALSTHLLLLPAIPSCALTMPLLFTGNEQGVIELWNLDWMARKWSLAVQDAITFIGTTPFAVQVRVAEHEAATELGEADEQASFVSLHNSSPSVLSPQSFSLSPSLSFLDESLGQEHMPAPAEAAVCGKDSEGSHSFVDLRELDKPEDRHAYSRILVVGTQHGRMLLMEEREGRVLIDVNVMDAALDRILVSSQYAVVTNNERVSGFVLTCANYETRTFYSLLFTYSSRTKSKVDSAPLTVSEASVVGPLGAAASSISSVPTAATTNTVVSAAGVVTGVNGVAMTGMSGAAMTGMNCLTTLTTNGMTTSTTNGMTTSTANGVTTPTAASISDDMSESATTLVERVSMSEESVATINSLMRVSGESDELSVMSEYFLGLFSLEEGTVTETAYEEGDSVEALRIVVKTAEGDVGPAARREA